PNSRRVARCLEGIGRDGGGVNSTMPVAVAVLGKFLVAAQWQGRVRSTQNEEKLVPKVSRRRFLNYFSGLGLGSTLLPGVLWAQMASAQAEEITTADIAAAEKLAGLTFTDAEREMMARGMKRLQGHYETLRETPLEYTTPPA